MDESAATAVRVDGVSKTFQIPKELVHTFKERALHPLRRPQYRDLEALHEISFEVPEGEFFGIVGRNGSGKSTLLKILAGIYAADQGRIYVTGRLSAFIELGVGFNPDLPARENVLLNATMLGLSPREARRRLDGVLEFAELGEFADLKLKNYSSGMMVRLAFAVMIQVDADVLLIDEVLAVGDAAFQQKCFDEFGRLRRSGTTVLFVTHDMGAVERFCDRAMLLERGGVVEIGETDHVANRYLELNFGGKRIEVESDHDTVEERWGDGRARVVETWFENEEGERVEALPTGEYCTHAMRVVFAADVIDPAFTIIVENGEGVVLVTADLGLREPTGLFATGEEVVLRTRLLNVMAPDRYFVTPGVADGGGLRWLDRPMRVQRMTVTGRRATAGVVELPFETALERNGAPKVEKTTR